MKMVTMLHNFKLLVLLCIMITGCDNESNAAMLHIFPNEPLSKSVDSIVVIKSKRQMMVFNNGRILKVYHVSLGPEPVGPKHFKNDGKTPEGIYHIDGKNPNSHYHKCLGVSYPSVSDTRYAKKFGKPTGGDIKIHGLPNGYGHLADEYVKEDWTLGCIALTDDEIDEVYDHVVVGTTINILP